MTRGLLLVTILLASYFIVSTIVGMVAVAVRRGLQARHVDLTADGWFWLRFTPPAAGLAVPLGLVLPAFLLYEPAHDGEDPGPVLLVCATATLGLVVPSIATLGRAIWSGWAFHRVHLASAQVTRVARTNLPVHIVERTGLLVGLVGVLRPRLVLSTGVRAACTEEELATIAAHEAAHLGARDNLKRLLLDACPDALRWTAAHREFVFAWSHAAEEEADDAAVGIENPKGRLALATLLVKLARLTAAPMPLPPLSSSLIEPDDLPSRVRRLLAEPESRATRLHHRGPLMGMFTATVACLTWAWTAPGFLQNVHQVSELVVRLAR